MTNGSARLQQRRIYTSRSQEHIWCMPKEELLKPLHKWTSKKVRPIHGGEFMRNYVSRRLLTLGDGERLRH